MLVSDIQTRVRRMFGDDAGVQLDDADIIRFINDGVRYLIYQNENLLEKVTTADLVANQQDYTLPADCLILRKVHYKTLGDSSYHKLKYLTNNEFDEYIDGWDGTDYPASDAVCYTTFSNLIQLFPKPSAAFTGGLKIYYNRSPVDVALPADTPDIPSIYHEILVNYCLNQAYEMDEDIDAAALKGKQVDENVKALRGRSEWDNEKEYPMITVKSEDNW